MTRDFFFFLSLLFITESCFASFWSGIHPSLIAGFGYTSAGGSQNIWLANSPAPGLENNYSSINGREGTLLLGLGLEKTIMTTKWKNLEKSLGIEMDYINNSSMKGTVHPMVNVAPDFDTLQYSFDMNSYLLLATSKLSKLNVLSDFGGYIQAGIGGAINHLSDYNETTPNGSSAASMLAPFGSATQVSFAYSIGAGIVSQISTSLRLSIGYRYVNTGSGGLSSSPLQQTNDTIDFSSLSHHFVTVSLSGSCL